MTVITKPVSISYVKKTLGESTEELSALCKSPKINIWSKIKPIRSDKTGKLLLSDYENANYGLDILTHNNNNSNPLSPFEKGLNNAWNKAEKLQGNWNAGALYLRPQKNYRLRDFEGYDTEATFPIEIRTKPINHSNTPFQDQLIYRYSYNLNSININYILPITNQLYAWYIGIIYKTDNGGIKYRYDKTSLQEVLNNRGQDYTMDIEFTAGNTTGYVVMMAIEAPNASSKPSDLDINPETNQFIIIDNGKFNITNTQLQYKVQVDFWPAPKLEYSRGSVSIHQTCSYKFLMVPSDTPAANGSLYATLRYFQYDSLIGEEQIKIPIYDEGTTRPTNIIYPSNGVKVTCALDHKVPSGLNKIEVMWSVENNSPNTSGVIFKYISMVQTITIN